MIKRAVTTTRHKTIGIMPVNSSAFVLRTERNGFTFKAGQFVNVHLGTGDTTREYSLYSGESEPFMDFLVREIPHGAFTPQLRALSPGQSILIDGPYDEMFTISDPGGRHLFIATGTGIAPFRSMVLTHPQLDYQIVHGVRSLEDRFGMGDFAPDRYIPCSSAGLTGTYSGRVTDWVRANKPAPNTKVYLCGSSAMAFEVKDLLIGSGIEAERIFAELFY